MDPVTGGIVLDNFMAWNNVSVDVDESVEVFRV
jgi:hypothetical protein